MLTGERADRRIAELETLVASQARELETERLRRGCSLEEIVERRTLELRRAALHDRLTGLPNRAMFFDRLQETLRRKAADASEHYAVLFIDFDRFKRINDTLGHEAGDKLLIQIGRRLSNALRASDTVGRATTPGHEAPLAARLGGDEFSILLEPLTSAEDAVEVAQRLLAVLQEPYYIDGHEIRSGASIGVALGREGYLAAEDVLRDADTAMYRAKSLGRSTPGRGGLCVFKPRMQEEAARQKTFKDDLSEAARRDELELHYQPIVSLTGGEIVGAEALLRWNQPERGRLSPGEFMALAEETGDIVGIGSWAIAQACRQAAAAGERLGYVSVNVSRQQVQHLDFVPVVERALAAAGLAPHRLAIEVNEDALMTDAARGIDVVDGLRALGVRVFLAEFGSGTTSLGAIRRFPVHGLKLDRSFIDPTVFSRQSAAIIHMTTTLSRDLELDLIAEGIETLDQVALLTALGCEHAQGYLFSRPVDFSGLCELLRGSGKLAA